MSAKVKLISFISAFVLVLGIMIIGVLSAEQVKVNIGGSVSFNATNVYARVSGDISGAGSGNKTFSTLTYSASETTGDESDWTNLALNFDSDASPILIEITVENLSTDRELQVSLENDIQASGLNISITKDSQPYTAGNTAMLPASTGDGSSTTTFTLTLIVANPDQSLTDVNFGYILNMYDESSVPVVTYPTFLFEVIEGTENEVRITDYVDDINNVVIPASFSLDTTPLTSFIMQDSNFSNLDTRQQASIYLGEFYYTEVGGERTKTNAYELETSLMDTLTFPITIEPTYRYEFEGYSEINAMLLLYAIIGPSQMGYTENINYYLTNDEFTRQAFTTEEFMSYIMEHYPEAESDPATLAPLFSTTGSTALETDPIASSSIIDGTDYIVKEIGEEVFYKCTNITSITIPDSVTSIGDFAFFGCSSLTSITIPESVTSIGSFAFQICSRLTSVDFGAKSQLVSIGNQAFYYCSGLTSITIPESVTSIGTSAFYGCSGLTSITIPESVTSIGTSAFYGCRGLTSITIPESVTSIGSSAFYQCSSLNEVTIESDDIYLDLTRQSACGNLINYVNATGETVKVLKSVVDSVDRDFTKNTYLNGSNFTRSVSEDGQYYVYTRK